jgi:membrane protein involved in colicin uptake
VLSRQPPNRLQEQPAMTVAFTLFTTAAVVIVGSIVLSTVLQMRGQRVAIKHQAEVRLRLDEQKVEMAANRERFEQRTQQLRETQHESLELKRREIALREEQAASLKQLVAMHEQLLRALGSQRPS